MGLTHMAIWVTVPLSVSTPGEEGLNKCVGYEGHKEGQRKSNVTGIKDQAEVTSGAGSVLRV